MGLRINLANLSSLFCHFLRSVQEEDGILLKNLQALYISTFRSYQRPDMQPEQAYLYIKSSVFRFSRF